ncbi:2-dehydropantoate 2-reductase (Ketopantoate reductase) (KPA reductase) (KPR) [Metarhizium acridum]|uniref:2-dehydropantoate 2-reductase (Ketopantoate reductase) (KPA reductase) (KPR) n=1 Tax=Metarhizium acridum TaxID=92637 RepID=UPI001C6CCB19|nr:2-dehydropantoate 2-reductase (Ketopantoate reductase) (KPA reductase) (KPR) [Metarhizium acridum]
MTLGPKLLRRTLSIPTWSIKLARSSSSFSTYTMPSGQQPAWLKTLIADQGPPPNLFAWTPENLGRGANHNTPAISLTSGRNDLDRRVFILGVGNIGRLYASYLARQPRPPPITLVVHRKELLTQWVQGGGVELTCGSVVIKNKDFDIEWWTRTAPDHGPVREVADGKKLRNLFISTKASAAMTEADRLRGYLDRHSTVVFAQNGMSKLWPPHGQAYIAHRYEAGNAPSFLACIVNHGVLSTGPFKSIHTAPADASIGPVLVNPQPPPSVDFFMAQVAAAPLLNSKSVSAGDLWLLQLEKLVMNAIINPLTALLRCKNGELFAGGELNNPLGQVLNKLLAETSAVIHALVNHESSADILASYMHQNQPSKSDIPTENVHELRKGLAERFSLPCLKKKLYRFGVQVGENRSSMLQDVEAGKPTEIRDFNGWLVDMAAFLGQRLDVSTHRTLIELVEGNVILNQAELVRRLL